MLIDVLLFFYCTSVLLSFSIFLFDGYLVFCLIWIFAIFYSTSNNWAALPNFVRLIWLLFFSSMILGRFLYINLLRQKSLRHLKDYNTSTLAPDSNDTAHFLSIKPSIFKYYVFACLFLFFLGITGVGQNPEFADQVNAASKSRLPYVINGLLNTLLSYWTFTILFASRYIPSSAISKFLNKVLPFRLISSLSGLLKFSAYLSTYATKFIVPLYGYLSLRYYMKFSWFSIKSSLRRLKISAQLLIFFLLILAILLSSAYLLSFLSVDLLELVIMKILVRADSYAMLDSDSLAMLSDEYSGNLFYFIHPFLKLIGIQAYDMPMGSFLMSKSSYLSTIGGPNIHLPVVLFILGGRGLLGYAFIILFGILSSLLLCYSRKNIISYVNHPNQKSTLFWSIFYFNSFLVLLQEPSAFAHGLFFAFVVYSFLRFLWPSLLYVFAKSSINI